jgi:hypothetical protein
MHIRTYALILSGLTLAGIVDAQNSATVDVKNGGHIDLTFSSAGTSEFHSLVLGWINASAHAVANYYGRFPVRQVALRINTFDGHGIRGGQTFGWQGAEIKISVGTATTEAEFADDWMLTHEMIHLAFPSVAEKHHWIEEGQATYVEPVARMRVGNLKPERVWADWVRDMPQGLPKGGDRGLDFTPTWGRTYWGGALFCLMADIEIHKRTRNQKGLETALRAVLEAGGNIQSDWDLERALKIGDQATGVPVLQELYLKMKGSPSPVNLDLLWQQLGVRRIGDSVAFSDDAPLAAIRRAIVGESH